jgi:dTDP-4-dehydrorhamnose reductase
MRLLLLGGTGQVGKEFRALPLPIDVEVVAPSRDQFDLEDSQAISSMIAAQPWSAVINAAAYTDVDRAESEEPVAFAVNAEAATRLATETGRSGIPLIQISTDYVFDGRKGAPYVEEDAVAPLNAYGRSKLAGELGVQTANPRHVILRTSWVYSPYRKNFVRTILRLADECDCLTVVSDQRGCPTAAADIAQVCLDIAVCCASEPNRARYGIYHFAGAGDATWFDFANAIIDMSTDQRRGSPRIMPIRTSEYPTPAMRPADTRLDCTAVVRAFGVQLRPWPQALAQTIHCLLINKDIP